MPLVLPGFQSHHEGTKSNFVHDTQNEGHRRDGKKSILANFASSRDLSPVLPGATTPMSRGCVKIYCDVKMCARCNRSVALRVVGSTVRERLDRVLSVFLAQDQSRNLFDAAKIVQLEVIGNNPSVKLTLNV